MSAGDKLQRRYDALTAEFIAPLLKGETVLLDKPIAPGAIQYFEHASSTDRNVDVEIFDALHRTASAIAPIRTVPWPDRDLLLLAMAGYNLVLMTDPAFERLFARGQRKKIGGYVDELTDAIAPPNTRSDALARQALLDPLVALRRKDVTAKSWAYTYRFIGRPVGSSVFSKPVFGKFKESQRLKDVTALFEALDETNDLSLTERLRALIARSPVTELLRLDVCATFRFGLATLSVLSDDAIRGGAAREIVSRGEWLAAPRLGNALGDNILRHAPEGHLYYALALCFDVQATATLDVPGPGLPAKLDLSNPDTARYAAVLVAFFNDPTMIDEIHAFDPRDRGVLQERCALLTGALPEGTLEEVVPLVQRCERPGARPKNAEVRA